VSHLKQYHAFKINGYDAVLGHIPNVVVEEFPWPRDYWNINSQSRTVTLLAPIDATAQVRSDMLSETIAEAVKRGTFDVLKGWRNEMYPVYAPDGSFLLEMERCASPLFGIVTYGIHLNAYVEDEEGLKMWIARRSRTKQTYPGMLDNSVAGGMTTGETPFNCAVREAMEEASIPAELSNANTKAVGCITYIYVRDSRAGGETGLLQPEVEYTYDLKLDKSFEPKPCDAEVEDFRLWTISELKDALRKGEFKPNCAMVVVDFFVRHGIITAENDPDYLEISSRLHRRLEYPTASHVLK
jgi:isopentenyldiphosphate isomerase